MQAIIYDAEIVKAIPNPKASRIDGINYCKSWGDFPDMGIAVICAFDYSENRFRVFCKDNLNEFQALVNRSTHILGFNSKTFDDKLCKANGLDIQTTYDLYWSIRSAAGTRTGSYTLGKLAETNLGIGKSGEGAIAPIRWQQGNVGEVIDYCLTDIFLVKRLLELPAIIDPNTGSALNIQRPF